MPGTHAILSASAAYRWLSCTPSARFEEQIPEEESDYAAEGTLAHDLAALVLSARAGIYNGSQSEYNRLMTEITDNELYSPEMLDHAEDYAQLVKDQGGLILIEQRVDFSEFVPLGYGTSDSINIKPLVLYITDLKYGAGIRVTAVKNKQMMLYALGALKRAYELGHKPERVVMTIYQPRAGGLSTWEISTLDLYAWAETDIAEAANLAIAGQGDFVAGGHCQFCKARNSCAAYFDKFGELLKIQDKRVMTPKDKATVLTYGSMISSWANKVMEAAIQDIQKGRSIPGFKLVAGRGSRKFTNEDAVVEILLEQGYESEDIFEPSMKPLTAIEKMLGPKRFGTVFEKHINKTQGKPQLVNEDDDRPAIGASAADDYDDEDDLL